MQCLAGLPSVCRRNVTQVVKLNAAKDRQIASPRFVVCLTKSTHSTSKTAYVDYLKQRNNY